MAKRLKLPKTLQEYTNRFLLSPRKYYALVHQDLAACYYGSRHQRPPTMRLIVAAIEVIDWECNEAWNADLCVKHWMKMIKYGVHLSTCQKVICAKDDVLSDLLFHCDNGTWGSP